MATVDMLQELGHSVLEVNSAEDAILLLDKVSVELLLTDVGLLAMSGAELARQVRDRWPESGSFFEWKRYRPGTVWNSDALHLSKPIDVKTLEAVISLAIDKPS
jgi:two-component SAPR family response regulator